ncbi:sugar phosphate nucleotidyltransferase [Paenibacillus massiliensis]|uniref:sugar phosphate nucleotidyltransferase n=1 Tax=Paenibacillus massiliensis TaxID=225917 RepID=UPI00046EC78D|nr:sugar phosphate nucleotidyltransferase [Paenibacillus massiliensis]
MKIILLSGGSGTRLWPLSNDSRSKQFLRILKDNNGFSESMVQRVWRQINEAGFKESTFITTSKSQVEMIQTQLSQCPPIIIEPERKDTFPAIALSVSYLLSKVNAESDEIVVVLPVDLYVDSTFFSHIRQLEQTMIQEDINLALIGVKPSYPTEKYGYIVPTQHKLKNSLIKVDRFVEKPSVERAKELIGESALWNCGVFAFKMKYLKNIMANKKIPLSFERFSSQYKNSPKISFDFEVLENENDIYVLPYNGIWKDLGTWDSLIEEMDTKQFGKGITYNCENVSLVNELDIPIVVMGINDAVVAASPDGILVSDITVTDQLKNAIKTLNNRPMYEERRWGWFKILDFTFNEEQEEVLTKRICIKKGKNLSYQLHQKRSETWNIISGVGEVILDDCLLNVKSGDVIQIQSGQRHSIRALKDLEIVEIQRGRELVEEDICRFGLSWDEILREYIKS